MPGNREVFSAAISAADRKRWDSQWEAALKEYQQALIEFPDDVTARNGLGFCYMQLKQWPQALDEYQSILKRDPQNVIALSKMAEMYVILNRRDDAYVAYLRLADLYAQAGQGARAEAAWQKAVQLSPSNPEPHERLAGYYFEKKDISAMIQQRLAAAQCYFSQRQFELARMQCEEVLRADGKNAQAHQLLTQILAKSEIPSDPAQQEADALFSVIENTHNQGGDVAIAKEYISAASSSSDFLALTEDPVNLTETSGNLSGGNTGIMGNMGSAGNYGGGNIPGAAPMAGVAPGMGPTSHKRITASQVTGVLKQAQTFQTQGRFNDAIDLCEQILESGFDRPDARYFLGWLYQEQQRWDEAIRQFQMLLNDPDYALSCYYALGQCYRARGDLRTATVHFDEAVDRVNLDALTVEEADQLVQLCQEAAEAHRLLGEQDQALTVYNALLGFLRSRGWSDKVAQVEFMLQQAQSAPMPARPVTPPVTSSSPQQMGYQPQQQSLAGYPPQPPPGYPPQQPQQPAGYPPQQPQQPAGYPPQPQQPQQPGAYPPQTSIPDAATMMFNAMPNADAPTMAFNPAQMVPPTAPPPAAVPLSPASGTASSGGELPDWLTGILTDEEKTARGVRPTPPQPPPVQPPPVQQSPVAEPVRMPEVQTPPPSSIANPVAGIEPPAQPSSPSWLMEDMKPATNSRPLPPDSVAPAVVPTAYAPDVDQTVRAPHSIQPPPAQVAQPPAPQPVVEPAPPVVMPPPQPAMAEPLYSPAPPPAQVARPQKDNQAGLEDLLTQIAGPKSGDLNQAADAVLASTAGLPENVRVQVVRSMQDIQKYINHGLLTSATEECLRVIDLAPQYLDVHQVLCEIYVRQGKVEQAITKYAILVDTYIVNGRVDDAIATYRRILQLEPNNLTYRMRLINLLSTQGNKEDLLRERTQAAESYLRLGYMDRALTELEQALQESPTSVPTRLNYALALQKLGRTAQAVAEYQRVLQVDPRNITALVRWHIAMITAPNMSRPAALEALTRVRWQLRGEGQKHAEMVTREYHQAIDIYPSNADVHFALGQIYQQSGQFDRSIDAYMQAMRDNSVEIIARVSAAHCFMAQGKPEPAIQQLEQALQIVRRSPNAVDLQTWAARPREEGEEHKAPEVEISLLLAKAYERTGRQEQMKAILRQLKQTKPAQDEVASTLAEISSSHEGDLQGAMQEYMDLVRHYRANRQTDNAINVLNEMVRLAPQDGRAHEELADIYINRGLLDEGIAELRMLADLHLRHNQMVSAGQVIQRIGNIYAEMGDNEEALANLCRAAELNPTEMGLLREIVGFCVQLKRSQDAVHYQVSIARHYFETHQVKESVAALQQLIAIDRSNLEAYDMLGQTYQSVGEYEQASRVYRNLAKVNPGSSIARERLATLQELRTR